MEPGPPRTLTLEDLHHVIARLDALSHAAMREFDELVDPDPLDRNRMAHLIGAVADTAQEALGVSAELLGFPEDVPPGCASAEVCLGAFPIVPLRPQ